MCNAHLFLVNTELFGSFSSVLMVPKLATVLHSISSQYLDSTIKRTFSGLCALHHRSLPSIESIKDGVIVQGYPNSSVPKHEPELNQVEKKETLHVAKKKCQK